MGGFIIIYMINDSIEVSRKYAGIDRPGKRVLREGSFQEFKSFGNLDNRFNASLLFDTSSESQFKERVEDPLSLLAEELGIRLLLAGRDFTVHTTLLEGLYEGSNEAERQGKFAEVEKSNVVTNLSSLKGQGIEFKYLLAGGRDIILAAINIPYWIIEKRSELAQTYKKQRLKPLELINILHITVSRITQLPPEGDRNAKLGTFANQVAHLRHNISSKPTDIKGGPSKYRVALQPSPTRATCLNGIFVAYHRGNFYNNIRAIF